MFSQPLKRCSAKAGVVEKAVLQPFLTCGQKILVKGFIFSKVLSAKPVTLPKK